MPATNVIPCGNRVLALVERDVTDVDTRLDELAAAVLPHAARIMQIAGNNMWRLDFLFISSIPLYLNDAYE